jgi:hypothetical protein
LAMIVIILQIMNSGIMLAGGVRIFVTPIDTLTKKNTFFSE